jgi:predicted Ser/Thr protein kinase
VAGNRLTKKWVVVKKDRQLREVIEMTMLLEALGIPL